MWKSPPVVAAPARFQAAPLGVLDSGPNVEPTWRVRVDIMRFDSEPAVAIAIDAIWSVQPPGKQAVIQGRTVLRESVSGEGYDKLVAAHNRALAAVSRDIAAVVQPSGSMK